MIIERLNTKGHARSTCHPPPTQLPATYYQLPTTYYYTLPTTYYYLLLPTATYYYLLRYDKYSQFYLSYLHRDIQKYTHIQKYTCKISYTEVYMQGLIYIHKYTCIQRSSPPAHSCSHVVSVSPKHCTNTCKMHILEPNSLSKIGAKWRVKVIRM